jgi:ribosomal protein L14E/L6E/L27E
LILDSNFIFVQALVDGPETGVPRGQMRLNQLHLTKYKISFPFTDQTKTVRKAWIKNKIDEKWATGIWAQKIAAKRQVCKIDNLRIIFHNRIICYIVL